MTIAIHINGASASVAEPATIADLLRQQGLDPTVRGIAVAINDAIVPCASWAGTALSAGDRIEIVKAFAGG
jgi:sulfur carrier protein